MEGFEDFEGKASWIPRVLVVEDDPVSAAFLESLLLQEGWLVLFDLRSKLAWTERLWRRTEEVGARRIHVVGC